ncbi:MAG TPA: hypothetical protein VFN90_01285 [Gemmatimonadales bacterium]|nr:hypothetical protein [Gemmatimonadales bacterium]
MNGRRGVALAALAAGLLAGDLAGQAPSAGDPWRYVAPASFRRTGIFAHRALAEASGVAVSERHPGVLWSIGDSGNPPDLLATDSTGRLRGRVRIADVPDADWEEVAIGACPAGRCVYIADTGDNAERRGAVALIRFPEPNPDAERVRGAEVLRFRYADGPHDVEAIGVLPSGDVLLVTKGRRGGVLVYRVPARAWSGHGSRAVATRVDSLPIVASLRIGRAVTGMALSADGRRAMVRTYRDLYPFTVDPATGRFTAPTPMVACSILGLEPQGEGIAWRDDRTLWVTSERGMLKAGMVGVAACGR